METSFACNFYLRRLFSADLTSANSATCIAGYRKTYAEVIEAETTATRWLQVLKQLDTLSGIGSFYAIYGAETQQRYLTFVHEVQTKVVEQVTTFAQNCRPVYSTFMTVAVHTRNIVILILLSATVYLPFLQNQLVWDDEQFIYNNTYVREFRVDKLLTENTIAGAGEQSNYYRPLTSISLSIDYQIWQNNPVGYHLTNLLLHTTAGAFLYWLLLSVRLSPKAAFWISAAFLTHPVQTEAVSYANSRGDSLFTLFGFLSLVLLTLLLHKKYVSFKLYNLSITFGTAFLVFGCILSYTLGILSKEIGIAILGLHALIMIHHVLFFDNKKVWLHQQAITILTFIALSIVATGYLALRATTLNFANSFNFYGDTTSVYAESLGIRMATFSKIIWVYLQILVLPYPLHMERDIDLVLSLVSPWPWLTIGLTISVLTIGLYELKKVKSAWIWFGASWALVMIAPVSGVIPINGLLYEHWLYTPLVGFALMLYGLVRTSGKTIPKWMSPCLLTVWILLSWRQNFIWSTPERLYTHTLRYAQTGRVHNNLAMAYAAIGKHQLAVAEYQKALRIADHYPQIYYNLANTYVALNDWESAKQNYLTALERNPNFEPAYPRLILLYIEQKKWTDAWNTLTQWKAVSENQTDQQTVELLLKSHQNATQKY